MSRIGVVLFNLGGPDRPESVYPFLRNLFSDPAIIAVPGLVRWFLARLIARRRAPIARDIYAKIGGASPIVPETRAQADALALSLGESSPDIEWKTVIAMRYWHPFANEAAAELATFAPEHIVLLPLYPQYSTTTTGSSAADWAAVAARAGVAAPTSLICCYPDHPGVVSAEAVVIADGLKRARAAIGPDIPLKLLLSAHGLPKRVIAGGDPYQWQVERTGAAIVAALEESGVMAEVAPVETVVCYQSRVGPLEWIGPATDAEITRAAGAGAGIVIAPIAFVSEHSETLVELDIEYRMLAEAAPCFERVTTLRTDPRFIAGLTELVIAAAGCKGDTMSGAAQGARLCPEDRDKCVQGMACR